MSRLRVRVITGQLDGVQIGVLLVSSSAGEELRGIVGPDELRRMSMEFGRAAELLQAVIDGDLTPRQLSEMLSAGGQ